MLQRRTRKLVAAGSVAAILLVAAVVVVLVTRADQIKGLDANIQLGAGLAASKEVGQSEEFITSLLNQSGKPVTIESAHQYGLAGYPKPTLKAFYVTGGKKTFRGPRLHNYVLPNNGQAALNYYVSAPRPGNYVSAGLTLVVRQGSTVETINSAGGAQVLCAFDHPVRLEAPACEHLVARVSAIVNPA